MNSKELYSFIQTQRVHPATFQRSTSIDIVDKCTFNQIVSHLVSCRTYIQLWNDTVMSELAAVRE